MDIEHTLEKLWLNYSAITPSAFSIKNLFESLGEQVKNDHIAFRTFNDPRVNIEKLALPFIRLGYEPKQDYYFEEKKLNARHYEHPDEGLPKIFISELILEKCTPTLQATVLHLLNSLSPRHLSEDLIFSGRLWDKPFVDTYELLRKESEYAAWLYLYGFVVNHFTIDVNALNGFASIEQVNDFLKDNGYKLNASGGEVKGKPSDLLQQSSILADRIEYDFQEGMHEVPGCYYEFAMRYEKNGKLFNGFITNSADKIFESTDNSPL
ncbi:DUF1338 domain-containing protein [Reichenbachiella sp. MALMAid0571]|uniref:DUF1338 domain-containing protein n=1 Tax=Reichenbachiella sp. MALMAid0571 TaxID=3143939 RepID=UPI0032DF980E